MLKIITHSFEIAVDAIGRNKLRSLLTSLGIIFGVASVITMLAIGKGAENQIMDDLKILGTNNILIETVELKEEEEAGTENEGKEEKKSFSPGLQLADADGIPGLLPQIKYVSPEISMSTEVLHKGIRKTVTLVGVDKDFETVSGLEFNKGDFFSESQLMNAASVCIIGNSLRSRFFTGTNPIGEKIKVGRNWLMVVGIAEEKKISESQMKELEVRNYNLDIYIPIKTMLLRYKDRSREASQLLKEWEDERPKGFNYNQLDRIVVQAEDSKIMPEIAAVLEAYFSRRHMGLPDYRIRVPEMLLKQKEKTQDLFSNVLVSIAFISLLVGGIGIMNIMLATVLERTREIGIRQAVGATRKDIVLQFLSEAVTLSVGGGLIGIFIGVSLSFFVQKITGIPTVVSLWGVAISFFVSVTVGLIFGWYPAQQAASQNPVESLRYE